MAEMVGSAVAQEAAHQVLSRFMERYEQRLPDAKECVERMEMAHIRLEAALEASNRWGRSVFITTSAPLLRWRSKLKRAAQECDHTLRRCRRRLCQQEEEAARHAASSLPSRVARTARSFVSSILGRGRGDGDDDGLGGGSASAAAVRRFERFADGASEFLRYVELGGAPHHRFTPLDGLLVRHLLAGRSTKHCSVHGSEHLSLILQPFSTPEHGRMQGTLLFFLQDSDAPENNFLLSLGLRLSESTDIVGVVVRCLELFTPHLRSTVDAVKTRLTQLPTQDLSWVPDAYAVFGRDEHRDNLHAITSQWFRPDLLCCQQQDPHHRSTLLPESSLASDAYLEPVIQVYLSGHVRLSAGQMAVAIDSVEAKDFQYLQLGGHLWPHASSEDLPPVVGGSATETITGEATQHDRRLHYANISYEQVGEIMLPQAVDRLRGNMAATSYQVLWRSKHGRVYLHAEKTSWRANARRDMGSRRGKRKKVRTWMGRMNEFVSSWMAYAPAQLQASALDWIQKQERPQLPLFLKITSCTHDCPVKALTLQELRSLARKIKSFSTRSTP
jgi:hypothetical protein